MKEKIDSNDAEQKVSKRSFASQSVAVKDWFDKEKARRMRQFEFRNEVSRILNRLGIDCCHVSFNILQMTLIINLTGKLDLVDQEPLLQGPGGSDPSPLCCRIGGKC